MPSVHTVAVGTEVLGPDRGIVWRIRGNRSAVFVTGLDLRFEAGGGSCSLTLRTELREGRVVVSSLLGFVQSCPGFAGSILDGALAGASGLENIAFTFEGLACNASLVFESYCVAGRFDLRFQGVTSGTVSITGRVSPTSSPLL